MRKPARRPSGAWAFARRRSRRPGHQGVDHLTQAVALVKAGRGPAAGPGGGAGLFFDSSQRDCFVYLTTIRPTCYRRTCRRASAARLVEGCSSTYRHHHHRYSSAWHPGCPSGWVLSGTNNFFLKQPRHQASINENRLLSGAASRRPDNLPWLRAQPTAPQRRQSRMFCQLRHWRSFNVRACGTGWARLIRTLRQRMGAFGGAARAEAAAGASRAMSWWLLLAGNDKHFNSRWSLRCHQVGRIFFQGGHW